MMNFIAQSMRRFGLAPDNKVTPSTVTGARIDNKSSPISHMTIGSKWSYSTLEYPSDIQSRSDEGHYMMFYINESVDGPISSGLSGGKSRRSEAIQTAHLEHQMKFKPVVNARSTAYVEPNSNTTMLGPYGPEVSFSKKMATDTAPGTYEGGGNWMPGKESKIVNRASHQGTAASKIGYNRTKRTTDSIVLYMPPNLSVNYAAAYKEEELGSTFTDITAIIAKTSQADGVSSGVPTENIEQGKKGMNLLGDILIDKANASVAAAGLGNPMASKNKLENQAINNYLEVMFTGISHRKFSYSWKFTPKNAQESIEVDKIIRQFRFHMLPEKPSDDKFGRYWISPSEFDIFYMFRGDENSWLNKISTCVLLNMDVNWTPNQYQTFRPIATKNGAPPVEVDLKLDFMETKLITKAEAADGY